MKDGVHEPQSSDPTDPLHGLSCLSLFPRTFRDSTNFSKPNHPDDVESIHGFMKSMALSSINKHLEQAKAISDGNSELLNSNFASFLVSENNNEAVAAKGKETAQERRPALGRKRARFSLKPNSSQPSVTVEPSLDIDQLHDPEEYFLAIEKFENAKKELQRQKGGNACDLNDYNLSRTERRRRPGILGKSVSYKHLGSSKLPESNDALRFSQKTLGQDILSSPNYISHPQTVDPNVELQETELTGSIYRTKNKVDGLLDELLSDSCEDLDGDGALSFLQERLQIKPLDLDKLCLPEFHNVGKNDFVDLGEYLPKPRKALSDIHNLVGGISSKTLAKQKQVAGSPVCSVASPTPPKSPFASISLFKKYILQSNLPSDPFSSLDLSPARNSSSVEPVDKQSDQYNTRKELGLSGELKSLVTETCDTRVDNPHSQEIITGDLILPSQKSVNDNSSRIGVGTDFGSSGSHGDLKYSTGNRNMFEKDNGLNTDTDVRANGHNEMDNNYSKHNIDNDIWVNGPSGMEENVGDMIEEALSSGDVNSGHSSRPCADFPTDGPTENEKNLQVNDAALNAEPDVNVEDPATGKLDGNQIQEDQSNPAAVELHVMDEPSETADAIPEQHTEKTQAPCGLTLSEQSMAKRPSRNGRKRRTFSHRQSLAGAGTFWEAGVRRSKRIRMRPLEFWKGERFLYGRVHESLATIIGLKYVSPSKGDGNPSLKVKSYVSDEYKELVELAALH